MRFSLPHRRRRVFSFFDFRSSFSRFSDFIEASREKKNQVLIYFIVAYSCLIYLNSFEASRPRGLDHKGERKRDTPGARKSCSMRKTRTLLLLSTSNDQRLLSLSIFPCAVFGLPCFRRHSLVFPNFRDYPSRLRAIL